LIITSPNNSRFKGLRRLRRRQERERAGRFVAEGEDLVVAAYRAGRTAVEGYRAAGVTGGEGWTQVSHPATHAGHAATRVSHPDFTVATKDFIEVEPAVLAKVSSLGSGTRVIGVYEQRFLDAPVGPLCVYLHGVSDPGNVGTILRAAEAFGASCVALGPGCADPYSPKAVRASMGAVFGVPLVRAATIAELPGKRVALVAHAGTPLGDLTVEQPLTLLIGAEREGLPDDVVSRCESCAHIPIRSESLNAAMAATIGMYEMTRVPS
jgi:RNA methyltransferase, TrmH family